MKVKYLLPLLILLTVKGNSQNKENQPLTQINDTMQYYNENQYKDWEIDPKWCTPAYPCKENNKHLMKGNDRVRIMTGEERIQIEKTNILSPYNFTYIYSAKTKNLLFRLNKFYNLAIGTYKVYDENGKFIEEVNRDTPYKFSIDALIEKMKREYQADLLNIAKTESISRYIDDEFLKIPVYEISYDYNMNDDPFDENYTGPQMKEYLIDGNTGKTLLIREWMKRDEMNYGQSREHIFIGEDSIIFIRKWATDDYDLTKEYKEYLKKHKRKKLGDNQGVYKTYKGKSYTESEWKVFEQEQFNTYARKNNIVAEESKGTGFFLDEREI